MDINFEELRAEYETGTETYAELAARTGADEKQLRRVARAERWNARRRAYRREVADKAVGKAAERESDRLACVMNAVGGVSALMTSLTEDKKLFYRFQVKCKQKLPGENGEPVEKVWAEEQELRTPDIHAVREYLAALKQLTDLIRELYDIPTAEGKLNRRLLKQKLAAAEAGGKQSVRVTLAPELEELGG